MILTEALTKSYGSHRVLDALAFEARPGQVTLLVGANGSGKSTTLRVVTGLSSASAGRVEIDGHDLVANRTAALDALSYLPQSPRFHPHLTVRQVLAFYARLRGVSPARVDIVAREWGLAERIEAATGRLSGGLRQRLALAVFALPDAHVLALDEPGLSLDPDWRRFLQQELTALARRGHTVLVATHLLGEWEGQADRCLVLEHGRVTRELPPDRLREVFPFAVPHQVVAHAG